MDIIMTKIYRHFGIQYKHIDRDQFKYELTACYSVRTLMPRFKWFNCEIRGFAKIQFGVLTIQPGYAWDGPSGPTIDTPDSMRGSLIHDIFYQMMREGLIHKRWRKRVDKELLRITRQDGMPRWRAYPWYWAVRISGGKYIQAA